MVVFVVVDEIFLNHKYYADPDIGCVEWRKTCSSCS